MNKYKCSAVGYDYYQEVEIEAENEEEAKDKYAEMIERGIVLAVDYDYSETKAELVGETYMDSGHCKCKKGGQDE
jgi:hypothetical protein